MISPFRASTVAYVSSAISYNVFYNFVSRHAMISNLYQECLLKKKCLLIFCCSRNTERKKGTFKKSNRDAGELMSKAGYESLKNCVFKAATSMGPRWILVKQGFVFTFPLALIFVFC